MRFMQGQSTLTKRAATLYGFAVLPVGLYLLGTGVLVSLVEFAGVGPGVGWLLMPLAPFVFAAPLVLLVAVWTASRALREARMRKKDITVPSNLLWLSAVTLVAPLIIYIYVKTM